MRQRRPPDETTAPDRDSPELFAERGFGRRIGFGRRPALLIVDLQRGFCDPHLPLGSDLEAEIQATRSILHHARRARIPIIYTVTCFEDPGLSDAGVLALKQAGASSLMSGTPAVEVDSRIAPEAGEPTISKRHASAFFGTDLLSRLLSANVDTVLIAGCTTSGCVRASAVDAVARGLRPMVIAEAVGDRSPAAHEQSLIDLDLKYADVVSAKETISYLDAVVSAESADDAEGAACGAPIPPVVDRATFQAHVDELREREKAHTRQADAIAAARRRLPMVEVDATTSLTGPDGRVTLLDAFEGRRALIAYYFMWHEGKPAAQQCEGCTRYTAQIGELPYLHSRDITYATLCQGPYEQSVRYRDFMGWTMPWYSAKDSLDTLLAGRKVGMFHLVCYLREGARVFETYWTNGRGVETLDNLYALMDLTVYGRQERWEDSPAGWPRQETYNYRVAGRPIAQWSRIEAGRSDDMSASGTDDIGASGG